MPNSRRNPLATEALNLRRSFKAFDRSLRRLAAMLGQLDGRVERRRKPRAGKPLRLSRERRAALKLHGRYIGYIRQLKPRQKAQVRRIREAKGVRAAIAKARVFAKRAA